MLPSKDGTKFPTAAGTELHGIGKLCLTSLRKGIDEALSGLHLFLAVTDHSFCLGSSERRVALICVIFCPPVTGHLFQGYFLNTLGVVPLQQIPKGVVFSAEIVLLLQSLCTVLSFLSGDRNLLCGSPGAACQAHVPAAGW